MGKDSYGRKFDRSASDIKAIKEHVPLADVVKEFTTLKQDGPLLKGLCPFHVEDTPSFVIYEKTQSYYCYGCGRGGDIFSFLSEKTPLDFKRIKEFLMNRFVIPHNQYKPLPKEARSHDTEEKSKAIKRKPGRIIPDFDKACIWSKKRNLYVNMSRCQELYEYKFDDGTVAGYILFMIDKDGKKIPFPVSLTEKLTENKLDTEIVWGMGAMPVPRPMWNLTAVINNTENKPVLIVEGERCAKSASDLLKDFIVVTWSGGASAVNNTEWEPLERYEVFIWPDNDPAGREAADKIRVQLPDVEILIIDKAKPRGWDIADAIKEGQKEAELTEFILAHRTIKEQPEQLPFDFDMPPGLLGELTQYILDASARPHPLLATGASLAILSVLQAQKVMTQDEIHPNLYILTLAPSGVGKSFAYGQIKKIMPQIGCKKLLSGTPASGAGLISALDKRQGRTLMPIDEFGQVIMQILGSTGDSCRNNLIEYFLKLFSESNYDFYDIEYQDRTKKNEQRIISKPNLVIYGTSIPSNFYEAVTASSALDGFLARILVLEGVDINVKQRPTHQLARELPVDLYDKLMLWASDPVNTVVHKVTDRIDEDRQKDYNFSPHPLPFQMEARELILQYGETSQKISTDADKNGDEFKASVYNRAFELASKVALLARTHGGYIDKVATEWAIRFVDKAINNFYNNAKEYIHTGEFDKQTKQIQRYLDSRCTWVTKRQLLNRFRIKPKLLFELLDYLIQADIIEFRELQLKKDRPITTPQWRIKQVNEK